MTQLELENAILELIDSRDNSDNFPRGDLQSAVECLARQALGDLSK